MDTSITTLQRPGDFLVDVLAWIIFLFAITIAFIKMIRRRGPSAESAIAKLKATTKTTGERLWLGQMCKLERGTVVYTRTITPFGAEHVDIKWISEKALIEAENVYLKDLCSKPPLVIKHRGVTRVELPALRIVSGDLKEVFVTCFNTKDVKAKSTLNLIYSEGYAKVDVAVSRGAIKTRAEWALIAPQIGASIQRSDVLSVDLCYEKHGVCSTLIELKKPGISESISTYPETTAVIFAHRSGAGFREVLDVIKDLPSLFGFKDAVLKVAVKRGFRKLAEVKANIETY